LIAVFLLIEVILHETNNLRNIVFANGI